MRIAGRGIGRQMAQAMLVGLLIGLMLCPPTLWVSAAWAAFEDVSATHVPDTETVAYRVVVGDVDGDGAPDALVAVNGQSRLLRNDGTGAFTDVTTIHLPMQEAITLAIALGDIDRDGDLDAVLAQATTRNQVWLGDGAGRFTDATPDRLPGTTQLSLGVTLADIDGDGDLDLLVANRGSQNRLWLNDGQGVFGVSPAASLPSDQDPSYGFAVADIDGDRTLDLLVVNQGAPDRLLRNNGLGTFTDISATHLPAAATDSLAATFADVDGDGDVDLVVAAGQDGLRLYHNDGQGQFTEGTATHVPPLDAYGIQVVTGDVDVDGDLDLVLAAAGQDQVLLNDGSGVFTNATATLLPPDTQRSFGVAIADVDGDLDPDLLVATPGGPERLLRNALPFPRVRLAVAPDVRTVGLPVTLTIEAVDEDGLATAGLTLTDPAGTPQTVDLLADLADGLATHGFTPCASS